MRHTFSYDFFLSKKLTLFRKYLNTYSSTYDKHPYVLTPGIMLNHKYRAIPYLFFAWWKERAGLSFSKHFYDFQVRFFEIFCKKIAYLLIVDIILKRP